MQMSIGGGGRTAREGASAGQSARAGTRNGKPITCRPALEAAGGSVVTFAQCAAAFAIAGVCNA
eukprot:1760880-Pleurochrysis_carterae.AAC.2